MNHWSVLCSKTLSYCIRNDLGNSGRRLRSPQLFTERGEASLGRVRPAPWLFFGRSLSRYKRIIIVSYSSHQLLPLFITNTSPWSRA